jgi:predicted MFS family arabinose efflux permease
MQYVGALVVIIGTILQVTAYSVGHLIAGRIVTGVGVGINTSIVPTVSLIHPPEKNERHVV